MQIFVSKHENKYLGVLGQKKKCTINSEVWLTAWIETESVAFFLSDTVFITSPIKLHCYDKHIDIKDWIWFTFNTNKPLVILSFSEQDNTLK